MKSHCSAGKVESHADLEVCNRLGAVICDRLQANVYDMVRRNLGRPILCAHQSDGWGAKVSSRCSQTCGDHAVVRQGKVRHDVLLERAVVRAPVGPGGSSEGAFLLGPPRGLSRGRTAWNMFRAACDFMPNPRVAGHEGIVVNIILQDGMLFEPVTRYMRGIRAMFYSSMSGVPQGPEHEVHHNSERTIGIKCKSHCCSNAVVWGLKRWSTGQISEGAHITIASLRNSAQLLH